MEIKSQHSVLREMKCGMGGDGFTEKKEEKEERRARGSSYGTPVALKGGERGGRKSLISISACAE